MEQKILQNVLTKNEAKIYLTLLELGSSRAGEITEKTGIHRRNVYDAIERLIQKGLISYVSIENKKLFTPVNPNRFLELIDEEKAKLDKQKGDFKKVLPQLELMRKEKPRPNVGLYKGIEGLKTVYEDILRTKKDYIGYGLGEIEEVLKFYLKHFIDRRVKSKIRIKLIYSEKDRGKYFTKTPLSTIRFLPDKYSSNVVFRIYGDKLAILLFSKEEPLAIIIKNKEIADGYRKYFEIMWNIAGK